VRVGGQVKPPELVHRVEPVYPDLAVHARLRGTAILEALVDNQGRVVSSPIKADVDSVAILKVPGHVHTGDYPKPIPFGGMGKPLNTTGFSDHFPIVMRVSERD
jgi:hypothetical protein